MRNGDRKNRRSSQPNNVVLIGMPASGKTTLGAVLAKILGLGFLDLDRWIEASSSHPVHELVANLGESAFRKMEGDALREISTIRSHVIAAGGGIVEVDDNWLLLKELGTTVWVDCPVSVIARRLVRSPAELKSRPLLTDTMIGSDEHREDAFNRVLIKLETILKARRERYTQADFRLGYGFSTPESGAIGIKALLGSPDLGLADHGDVSSQLDM